MKLNLNRNLIITIIIFISSAIGITTLQKPLLNPEQNIVSDDVYQQEEAIGNNLALIKKLPTFGFDNLISSWLFLDFIQYYGNSKARDITGYRLLPKYYEIIVDKDPRYVNSYFILDPATTLFSGRPDLSVRYMNQGLNYLQPEQEWAHQVWFFKAIDELLFLGETQEAIKSYEKAAEWVAITEREETAGFYEIYQGTAEFLKQNPDSRQARFGAWMMVFRNAPDDKTRIFVLKNLKELGAKITVENGTLSIDPPDDGE